MSRRVVLCLLSPTLVCVGICVVCERNAFGTTHFFQCDPVLRLGPRIFFQCDPVCCVCVCVYMRKAKGGLRYPRLFSSPPPAVPHLAHLRVGQRPTRPFRSSSARPMESPCWTTTSTTFDNVEQLLPPNLVPSTGWGPAERAFPSGGFPSGGFAWGGAEAAERFDPSLSSVAFHWTAGGERWGRLSLSLSLSLSALEAWKMCAGSVRGRQLRLGRARRAEGQKMGRTAVAV